MPIENDNITNADESRRLPDENPTPMKGAKKDYPEGKPDLGGSPLEAIEADHLDSEPEGRLAEGNVAAEDEEDTTRLDGSNANNLRTK
ncbi:hypothetical protein ACD591_18350 [Rufibacter glacialis]|uniref:Uncharacterized protein n=1 Tax=Rufibacter glacialis TaxID=1259555 RepID=A0A5M8Q7A4_9BACT|nr:hypothetical protein [Rufibacter glacialis]KAA6430804.1 hypothetical protein FOE74_20270 [Rufibacter glacialis]GGK86843.1 hypothetical protein GCM10011405_38290 [Rufibacter glacialis]